MKFQPYWYVIAALVMIIILQRACSGNGGVDCPDVRLVKTETQVPKKEFLEIPRKNNDPKPEVKWMTDIVTVEVPADVDTAAILSAYFQKMFYSDTIQGLDTGLHYRFTAVINDSVYENRIQHRQFFFLDLKPATINTFEVAKPRNKWFIGGQIGGSRSHFDAGVSLMLMTKKDLGYAYTYQALSRTHNATLYWKISFRK